MPSSLLDLALSSLLWRQAINSLLGIDILPILSIILLTSLAYSSCKLKTIQAFIIVLAWVVISYSLLSGQELLTQIEFLDASQLRLRLFYQYATLLLFVVAYSLKPVGKRYAASLAATNMTLWIFTCVIILSQTQLGVFFSDLFVSSNGGFRAFTTENGVLCNILLLITLVANNIEAKTKVAAIPFIIVTIATRSSLSPLVLLYYALQRILINEKVQANHGTRLLLTALLAVLTTSILALLLLPESLSKVNLLIAGGGKADLGGRYVANRLILAEIINNPSIIFLGKGLISYQVLLQSFQFESASFSELSRVANFDYGGSDILLLLYESGIFLPFTIIMIFIARFRTMHLANKSNLLLSFPFVLVLLLKGIGLFSPFILYTFYFILP